MTGTGRHAANLLTLLRLFCVPPIVVLILHERHVGAMLLFVLAALTDLADGFVAKRISGRSALGAVLDPLADKLLMAGALLALAVGGHVPAWLVVLVIGRDLLMVLGTLALRLRVGRFRIAPLPIGKLSTALQLTLVAVVLTSLALLPQIAALIWPLALVTAAVIAGTVLAYLQAAARILASARPPC